MTFLRFALKFSEFAIRYMRRAAIQLNTEVMSKKISIHQGQVNNVRLDPLESMRLVQITIVAVAKQ
jgi:hypothetical protein